MVLYIVLYIFIHLHYLSLVPFLLGLWIMDYGLWTPNKNYYPLLPYYLTYSY